MKKYNLAVLIWLMSFVFACTSPCQQGSVQLQCSSGVATFFLPTSELSGNLTQMAGTPGDIYPVYTTPTLVPTLSPVPTGIGGYSGIATPTPEFTTTPFTGTYVLAEKEPENLVVQEREFPDGWEDCYIDAGGNILFRVVHAKDFDCMELPISSLRDIAAGRVFVIPPHYQDAKDVTYRNVSIYGENIQLHIIDYDAEVKPLAEQFSQECNGVLYLKMAAESNKLRPYSFYICRTIDPQFQRLAVEANNNVVLAIANILKNGGYDLTQFKITPFGSSTYGMAVDASDIDINVDVNVGYGSTVKILDLYRFLSQKDVMREIAKNSGFFDRVAPTLDKIQIVISPKMDDLDLDTFHLEVPLRSDVLNDLIVEVPLKLPQDWGGVR